MEKIELRTVEKEKLRKFFKPLDSKKKKMIKIIVEEKNISTITREQRYQSYVLRRL